ncbi:MAG: hypothetical protein RBU21_21585 [FCB group bacterium]|jgi:hypothetical protein|nr:hypothetical protein [FCB group bacterium]
MSKKKERTRQELSENELNREREDFQQEKSARSLDFMEDDMDVPDHNPNVDKDPGMKRKERDNIE